jgi:ribosomal protein L29
MKKKQKQELKDKETTELRERRRELAAALVKKVKVVNLGEIRREAARIATILRQREMKNETA